jgi:hypothetical protein
VIILRALYKQFGEQMRLRVFVGHGYEQLHEAGELWMTVGEFFQISQGKFQPEYDPDDDEASQ